MSKTTGRLRSALDVFATIAMALAAIVIIWRASVGDRSAAKEPSAVEDLSGRVVRVRIDAAKTIGDATAPLVLLEFADFECPFCGKYAQDTFPRIRDEYVKTGKLLYAFRGFPLERIHKFARAAALAGDCAARQGHFWDMHAFLYENQRFLSESVWLRSPAALALDEPTFEACLDNPDDIQLEKDILAATQLQVESTPTFFLGRSESSGAIRVLAKIRGARTFDVFKGEIERLAQGRGHD